MTIAGGAADLGGAADGERRRAAGQGDDVLRQGRPAQSGLPERRRPGWPVASVNSARCSGSSGRWRSRPAQAGQQLGRQAGHVRLDDAAGHAGRPGRQWFAGRRSARSSGSQPARPRRSRQPSARPAAAGAGAAAAGPRRRRREPREPPEPRTRRNGSDGNAKEPRAPLDAAAAGAAHPRRRPGARRTAASAATARDLARRM